MPRMESVMRTVPLILAALLAVSLQAAAAPSQPVTLTGAPQADGAVHTLRQIPEACVRIEGRYTGQEGRPYALAVVPLGGTCQPRARFAGERPATELAAEAGWQATQRIAVPSAACPERIMTLTVWQREGAGLPPADGQGQTRVYLKDAARQATASQDRRPAYAVSQTLSEGCRR